MRDVGIVAGVLYDSRRRAALEGFENSNREADVRAIWKLHFDGIRTFARHQRLIRRARCGRRAGTRGPAALERPTRSLLIRIFGVAHIQFQWCAPRLITIFP